MRCIKCGCTEDKVLDSRSVRNGMAIRRRRVCSKCGYRFTTYEQIVRAKLKVKKRDGRYEEFDPSKLRAGIEKACEKRPISSEQIDNIVDSIIEQIESEYDNEVPSEVIGQKVMEKLEVLDEVAFVRFASVYRRFKDVNQFINEIESLIRKSGDLGSRKSLSTGLHH